MMRALRKSNPRYAMVPFSAVVVVPEHIDTSRALMQVVELPLLV